MDNTDSQWGHLASVKRLENIFVFNCSAFVLTLSLKNVLEKAQNWASSSSPIPQTYTSVCRGGGCCIVCFSQDQDICVQ